MYIRISRKMIVILTLLCVFGLASVPAVSPVMAIVSTSATVDQTQALSMLSTLPYIRQLCPGDVVQGAVPLRGYDGLLAELTDFFNNGNTAVFAKADLYYFYGNQGDIVNFEVHPLTAQLDPLIVLDTGFDMAQQPIWYVNRGGRGGDETLSTDLYLWAESGLYTFVVWDLLGVAGELVNLPYELRFTGTIPPCEIQEIQISIDIKPGSPTNSININGNGIIPVAVLGSASFDVSQIDINTLQFAGMDVRVRGNGAPQCGVDDVNADGFGDLVCQFADDPTQWSPDNGTASVTGNLRSEFGGTPFRGTDSINLVQG